MSENKKIAVFLISIPVIALIIIFVISKVKFAPSFSPVEQKVFSFTYENSPRITTIKPLLITSVKNPIDSIQTSEHGFPKASLAEMVPLPAATDKRISFILINQKRKLAIIDGKLVHEGDKVDNHTISKIEKDKVLLKNKEGEKWLKLD